MAQQPEKKTILITGSSTGIGKSTAKFFQQKGWNVIATMRSPEKEQELNKLDNVLVTKLDVVDKKSMTDAIDAGIKTFGKIDVLCNNAGYGCTGIVEATPMDKIRKQYEVNVFGLFELTKLFIPIFRKQKSGVIINVSSVGGRMVFPSATIYNSSKFAVEGFSEGLRYELEPLGIKVKLIEPGAIKTDFGTRSMDFNNDEKLVEYQSFVATLMKGWTEIAKNAIEAVVVAEVIFKAATDNTDQLRYAAGESAQMLLENRKKADDETFFNGIKKRLGLIQ